MLRRLQIASIGIGCMAALSACGPADSGAAGHKQPARDSSVRDSPVISQPERANGYPEARVSGVLVLRSGCLLIGNILVFWPLGATWNDSAQAVTFESPPFQDAPAVHVGTDFDGGAGYYQAGADFSWLGEQLESSIARCQRVTNTQDVVFAYLSMTR